MRAIFLFLLLFAFSACTATRPSPPPKIDHLSRGEVMNWINARPSPAEFLSWNGHWKGTDCDAGIFLAKHGKIKVIEYGYSLETYQGTYTVDPAGTINVSLKHYPDKWPSMYLTNEKHGALLYPKDQNPAFILGGRAGAAVTAGNDSYWPFRQTE